MRGSRPQYRVAGTAGRVKKTSACELPVLFASWLGLETKQPQGLYDSIRTFWLFLYQILTADGSCQKTVDEAICWIRFTTGQEVSDNTSAYCQARKRLRLNWLMGLARRLIAFMEERVQAAPWALWQGRRVVIVDGTTASMPDTKANQQRWPQPSGQAKGCGFPVVRLVGLFSLATGALLEVATGSLHDNERTLFRRLWKYLRRGDVVLSDKGFGSFAEFHFLLYYGVDFVARLNPCRSAGVRHKKWLNKAKGDRLVEWVRSGPAPDWVEASVWESLPEVIEVREITYNVEVQGYRTKTVTIVTTLLDDKAYPPEAFGELYLKRWRAEIWFRDLKTTMGMEVLATKSPGMIERELVIHWIGYNLVRALMLDARERYEVETARISFKGCLNLVRTWAPVIALSPTAAKQQDMLDGLLHSLSRQVVRGKTGRTEPRATKRRPKNYQRLTAPRHEFHEIPHRNRYKKDKATKAA